MEPNEPRPDAEGTAEFERELGRLIAASFARGATIERSWTITTPVTDAPNWTVRIEKRYSDDDPPYEPQLLED